MSADPKDYSSYDIAVEIAECLTLDKIEQQCKRFLEDAPTINRTCCALCQSLMGCDDCVYNKFSNHGNCGCILYSKQYGVKRNHGWVYSSLALAKALERYCMAYLMKGDK